jgi:hypothetical protein
VLIQVVPSLKVHCRNIWSFSIKQVVRHLRGFALYAFGFLAEMRLSLFVDSLLRLFAFIVSMT